MTTKKTTKRSLVHRDFKPANVKKNRPTRVRKAAPRTKPISIHQPREGCECGTCTLARMTGPHRVTIDESIAEVLVDYEAALRRIANMPHAEGRLRRMRAVLRHQLAGTMLTLLEAGHDAVKYTSDIAELLLDIGRARLLLTGLAAALGDKMPGELAAALADYRATSKVTVLEPSVLMPTPSDKPALEN